MTTATDMVGSVLDGKLRLDRLLASGASGDVYEAHHKLLGVQVAVKVLRPGGGETADIRRKRFLREARVGVRLRSPHVVRVFDVAAPEDGEPYIVMELLEGETVAERLQREGRLPVDEAVELALQTADALAEMHEAAMVHRDVKPSNLFLAREGKGAPRIKLLDFGVAALRQPVESGESSITYSETFLGTPRYMAPEQVRSSKHVDARADVWALGVTLYELLTGQPAFDGKTAIVVLNQIERGAAPPLESLRPELPPGLVTLVRRCMALDPEARPRDAAELRDALRACGAGSPVTSAGQPRSWKRRVALAAVAAVGMTVAMLVGLHRRGDAHPSIAEETPPDLVPSAPAATTLPDPAATTEPASPAASSLTATVPSPAPSSTALSAPRPDALSRPRPRPAPAKGPPAPRPPRQDDDRIE